MDNKDIREQGLRQKRIDIKI